jgi:hypothetical protein
MFLSNYQSFRKQRGNHGSGMSFVHPYLNNIGFTDDCHTSLLSEKSFAKAEPFYLE